MTQPCDLLDTEGPCGRNPRKGCEKKKNSQVLINHNHTGTDSILVLTISVIMENWFSVSKAKLCIEEKKVKPAFATFSLPQSNMCVCINV